jgi:hypothetical protein
MGRCGCAPSEHENTPRYGQHVRGVQRRGLRDLVARMGHDSERAAMIYQHEARGADQAITRAIDTHVQAVQASPAVVPTRAGRASAEWFRASLLVLSRLSAGVRPRHRTFTGGGAP